MPQAPLTIRRAQLRALSEPVFEEFLRRLADHVAGVFPDLATLIQSAKGRRFVRHCVERARRLGITDQHSLALFTDLCAALGPHFDRDARLDWIVELLNARELGGSARLFMIYTRLPERWPKAPLTAECLESQIDSLRLPDVAAANPGRRAVAPRPQVPQWPAGFWG